MLLHYETLAVDEVRNCSGVLETAPLRTAYDLARWNDDLSEAVVAVDALARCRFQPAEVLRLSERYPRARGRAGLAHVVELAVAYAESPMESRLRMVLVLRGLPTPEVQWPVLDDRRRRAIWLDMAYPEHRIAAKIRRALEA